MEKGKLNLGMNQLITRERERLEIRFVSDSEIWLDDFTVLPGYEGYEHFTLERGYGLIVDDSNSFQLLSNEVKKFYPSQEEREKVFEFGYEFISIMKLAALSIGNAAVYGKEQFSDLTDFFPPQGTDLFWLHLIQSWILMGTATDKLRSFFIQFVRSESEKKINKNLKKLQKSKNIQTSQFVYTQAFREIKNDTISSTEAQKRLGELQELLESIATIRQKRNKFVHDYVSREAMIIVAQRDSGSDHADAFKAFIGDKHTNNYIEESADAYKILVKAGNLVFLLEKDVTKSND